MAQGILERFDSPEEETQLGLDNAAAKMRVSIPGIIESFDSERQTATVQPAITENIRLGQSEARPTRLPLLTDVPVLFPRAGGYSITFPVKNGDECLLIFADMCIDGWWQSGGVQDQIETRRHDLSDAVAILGITSIPKALKNFSVNSMQMRSESDEAVKAVIDIQDDRITFGGNSRFENDLTVNGNLQVNGNAYIAENLTVGSDTNIGENLSAGGNSQVNGDSRINGDASVGKDLNVSGNSQINGNSRVDGDLTVAGDAGIGKDISVGGNSQVSGDSRIDGDVNIGAELFIDGDVTAKSSVSIAGTLTVAGVDINNHTHSGVTTGAGATGPPVKQP